jgi:hypothetical protein
MEAVIGAGASSDRGSRVRVGGSDKDFSLLLPLNSHQHDHGTNFILDFAATIPVWTIAAILGQPSGYVPNFANAVCRGSNVLAGSRAAFKVARLADPAEGLFAYPANLMYRRQQHPQGPARVETYH